jgi:hypothetical protein
MNNLCHPLLFQRVIPPSQRCLQERQQFPTRHHDCPQTSGEALDHQKEDQEAHPAPVGSKCQIKPKCRNPRILKTWYREDLRAMF